MNNTIGQADRTLLVFSAAYLASGFAFSDWVAVFRPYSTGSGKRLLPVRIEHCEVLDQLDQVASNIIGR